MNIPPETAMRKSSTFKKMGGRTARIEEYLVHLTPIDIRLLQWLLHYPFQRTDDLVIGVARWTSRATVYRHVDVLQHMGLVECVRTKTTGEGKHLYFLSNLGVHVLAAQLHMSPKELAHKWQADEQGLLMLLPRLPTLLIVQDVVNGLVSYAADAMTHQGRHPSLVRWNWQRDYIHRFDYREQATKLTADGALAMCIRASLPDGCQRDQWFSLLLLHTRVNDERLMRLRLDRILRWRESPERWPRYQHMPLVVVLATSARQCERWHHCAEEMAITLRLDPLLGAIARLPAGSTASDNPWLLPWRSLATGTSSHLQDMLSPLPLSSIPAVLRPDNTDDTDEEQQAGSGEIAAAHSTRMSRLIYGDFAGRAARISIDNEDERECIALITGLRLTPRLWGLLHLFLDHPLLSANELAALLHVQFRSVRGFLYELRSLGCITSVITDVGERWHLSGRGLHLLAAAHHFNIRNISVVPENTSLDIVQRGQEWLLQHIQHTAGIYGFFAALAQAGTKEQALLWWETGAACERRYRVQDRWYNLRPDALAEYMLGKQHFRFWLEWDCGTMNVRDLSIKFTSYAQYISSREWARERSVLPMLLCVTPDIAQEKRIWRVAQAMLKNVHGLVMKSTTAVLLAELGPLASIWLQCIPSGSQSLQVDSMRRPVFDTNAGVKGR